MIVFRPLPSSGRLCARRNASSRKTLTSSFCSSTLFLSKILPSSFNEFAVSLLREEMSCVGFSRISMVPAATADFVVLFALPCTTVGIEGVGCNACTTFSVLFLLPSGFFSFIWTSVGFICAEEPVSFALYSASLWRSLKENVPVESLFLSELASLAMSPPLRSVFFST